MPEQSTTFAAGTVLRTIYVTSLALVLGCTPSGPSDRSSSSSAAPSTTSAAADPQLAAEDSGAEGVTEISKLGEDKTEAEMRACTNDEDCVISCRIDGDCCPELCGCSQVYNKGFLAQLQAHQMECAKDCPRAKCARPRLDTRARCEAGTCRADLTPTLEDDGSVSTNALGFMVKDAAKLRSTIKRDESGKLVFARALIIADEGWDRSEGLYCAERLGTKLDQLMAKLHAEAEGEAQARLVWAHSHESFKCLPAGPASAPARCIVGAQDDPGVYFLFSDDHHLEAIVEAGDLGNYENTAEFMEEFMQDEWKTLLPKLEQLRQSDACAKAD